VSCLVILSHFVVLYAANLM